MKSTPWPSRNILYSPVLLAVAGWLPLPSLLLLLLLAGALAAGLYAWHRRRVDRDVARRMNEVKAQLARDFHDEMGSRLTVITLYGELARQSLERDHPAEAVPHVDKVVDTSRHLYAAMKDLIWTLRPNRGETADLWDRLETSGKELFADTRIVFTCQLDEALRERPLPQPAGRHLLLLAREALNNAYKHAEAERVALRACLRNGDLLLEVEDDGRGFAARARPEGCGMENMRARARHLGGRLSVASSNEGTRVRLRAPLPEGAD